MARNGAKMCSYLHVIRGNTLLFSFTVYNLDFVKTVNICIICDQLFGGVW